MFEISEGMKWALVQFGGFLAFLYTEFRRVRKEIDTKMEEKVNLGDFNKERIFWQSEIEKLRQEHKGAIDRLEKQSAENINQRFQQLADTIQSTERTIQSTEKHLSDKIEMVIRMISAKE